MISVLDYGHVRLVESMGNDLSVVRNARVSYDAAPRLDGSDEKLIRYLYLYHHHLAAGIPRELARCFLSLNTYTHFFATVDLRNLFHFLALRLHEHAQYEIRVYAEALVELVRPIVPVAVAAFEEGEFRWTPKVSQ